MPKAPTDSVPQTDSNGPADAVDLQTLVRLFYNDSPEDLASFESVAAKSMPQEYRQLLDHHSHMTITVESFYGSSVDVTVFRTATDRQWYGREISLVSQDSGKTVQYGIVRLRPKLLQSDVWQEIEAGRTPLGQVLIRHNVFRQVELVALWKVVAGPALAKRLEVEPDAITYGRTARIFCDGEPAIELLEIVAPV
jgi:chorismate-pyruvate lyase